MEEDFFFILHDMLQNRPEVSDVHCIKGARVPLMRFKFNGITVDFPYAQLLADSVPDDVDLFDPYVIECDETSIRSLSGARVNRRLLQLVPDLKKFQAVLRCIKLWARKRGIYSHLHGFFGGIHLAILTAFVCQIHPMASISYLVCFFFVCFAKWQWPRPVVLQGQCVPYRIPDGRNYMPIMMPCSPFDWCNSNITPSTASKIMDQFRQGYDVIMDIREGRFQWSYLFEPFPYTTTYNSFLRILLTAPNENQLREWVGLVKSRLRSLLLKIEMVQGFCDPNPLEYVDNTEADPNVVFYWGLTLRRGKIIHTELIKVDFMRCLNTHLQSCRLELSIVRTSQLPDNFKLELSGAKESEIIRRAPNYDNQPRRPMYHHESLPYPRSRAECY